MMGALKIVAPDDAHIIDLIDPYFHGRMNDLMGA